MKKFLFTFLLLIAGSMAAKAQWGYNPYALQFQMFQQQQMEQAARILQQQNQQMFQNIQWAAPSPVIVNPVIAAPVYTPSDVQPSPNSSNYNSADILNKTYGEKCRACGGTGKCQACHGTKIASYFGNTYRCNACNSNGDCGACNGTGLTDWNRR